MKLGLAVVALALSLTACGSIKTSNDSEPIRNQKLSTSFKEDTIRIETDCTWYKPWQNECDIVSITSIGSATTNGNTTNNRMTAMTRAKDKALANVAHFMSEEVSSNRVSTTLAKNVEKASDRLKSRAKEGEVVEMSDKDAEKDTNFTVRENSNDTAFTLAENIRVNARARLRGFIPVKQEVSGSQEVTVTMRWTKDSDNTASQLRKRFGN
jgi:hypothetical protein